MSAPEGRRDPETRQGRETLTVSRPYIEAALASLTVDGFDMHETRRFGNRLAAEAERWMKRGGFGERGRISKADAHRMLAQACHGEQNRLARYHRRDRAE